MTRPDAIRAIRPENRPLIRAEQHKTIVRLWVEDEKLLMSADRARKLADQLHDAAEMVDLIKGVTNDYAANR